jgi:hypothetical protein
MKQKRLTISAFLLLLAGLGIHAQELPVTSGGESTGSGGTVSYSIGQVFYETKNGSNGSVADGVQQAYEISILTALEGTKSVNITVNAFPNPTTSDLTLTVGNLNLSTLSFQLYDIQGKLLQKEKITGTTTTIPMATFLTATYFLKVMQGNKEVKTFKIIKK